VARPATGLRSVAGLALVEKRKGGNVTEERIRARRIELVDDEGNVRMILGGGKRGEHGPRVDLYDENGKWRASLGLTDIGDAVLGFYDEDGKRRAGVGASSEGTSELLLSDASGVRAGIGVYPGGAATLDIYDGSGNRRALLRADSNGQTGMHFFDENDNGRVNLGVVRPNLSHVTHMKERLAQLGLDPAEIEPLTSEATSAENAGIGLSDAEGMPRINLATSPLGTTVGLVDPDGTPRVGMTIADEEARVVAINEDQVASLPPEPEEPVVEDPVVPEIKPRRGMFLGHMKRWTAPTVVALSMLVLRRSSEHEDRIWREVRPGYYGKPSGE
jgi:hypothetical protein